MAVMDRTGVARALDQLAAYLELKGENTFRVRAFTGAAKTVEGFPGELEAAIADGSLAEAKGIGPAILQVITELVQTGRSELLEQLREDVPPGLVEMLGISGLGVSKVRTLHETLGIETLAELEVAARDGRLAALPRFGQRTAENILRGITFLRAASEWRLSHHAAQEAHAVAEALGKLSHILAVHIAGDVRRSAEVVRDLVLVLVADSSADEVFRQLAAFPGASEIAGQDERRDAATRLRQQRPGDRDTPAESRRGAGPCHGQRRAPGRVGAGRPDEGVQSRRDGALEGQSVHPDAHRGGALHRARPAVDPTGAARGGRGGRIARSDAAHPQCDARLSALSHDLFRRQQQRSGTRGRLS